MRIYEIVIEGADRKYGPLTHDRFRCACTTFAAALNKAQLKIKNGNLAIRSIELVADTKL